MPEPTIITFVDLETTGFNPETCEIIELAAIRTCIEDNKIRIIDLCEHKVLPEYPVDPFIARINGYNENDWSINYSEFDTAIGNVFDLMRGAWHAGSNPRYDEAFLKKAAEELRWDYPKLASYHLLDVSMQAFPLLITGEVEKLRQEVLCKYYDIPGGGHRALADAMQCFRLFANMNNLKVVEINYENSSF